MAWDTKSRAKIVQLYFKTGSIVQAQRDFRRETNSRTVPNRDAILQFAKRFLDEGTVNKKPYHRRQTSKKKTAIAKVQRALRNDPQTSSRALSSQTAIPRTTVRRVLHEDLGLYPYKIEMVQKLYRGDKSKRIKLCRWMLDKIRSNKNFTQSIFMTDEAHFHLNGVVQKQNCRIWCQDNPHVMVETEQYPEFVTVWCGISAKGIIGPYFFEKEGERVSVDATRYCEMIKRFFIPQLQKKSIKTGFWFQQDGATAHTAKKSMSLLRERFPNRMISKYATVAWPPRSPDLTAPDFFLWGFVKNEIYRTPVKSIKELKTRIRKCIKSISLQTLQGVMRSVEARCKECLRRQGGHLENVIFKHKH